MQRIPKNGRLVLAEGEVTGHAHTLPATAGCLMEEDGVLTLMLETPAEVTHEEHKPLRIEEPGQYTIGIVREVDPATQLARNVND